MRARTYFYIDDDYALEEELKTWSWAQAFDDYCGCCEFYYDRRDSVFGRRKFFMYHIITGALAAVVAGAIIYFFHIQTLLGGLLVVAAVGIAGLLTLFGFFQHVERQLDACKMHMKIHESRWPTVHELAKRHNFDASVVPPEPESALEVSRRTRSGWRRLDEDDDAKDDTGDNSVNIDGASDDIAADMDAMKVRGFKLLEVEVTEAGDAETGDTSEVDEAEPEPAEDGTDDATEIDSDTIEIDPEAFKPPEDPGYFDGISDELSEEAPVEPEAPEPVTPRSTEDLLEEIRRMLG